MPNPNDKGPPLTPQQEELLKKFVDASKPVQLPPGLGKTKSTE